MRIMTAVLAAAIAVPCAAQQQTTPQNDQPVFSPLEFDAAMKDPKRFTIDQASVEIVRLSGADIGIALPKPPAGQGQPGGIVPPPGTPGQPGTDLPPFPQLPGSSTGEDPITTIDRIVNLAKKIFDIIKENQPVVDVTTTYANAVPDGMTHWAQLGGWSKPETSTYAFYAKNMYGSRAIECRYQVIRQHSGNYKGKGKYLTMVTVQPLSITALWGYKFSMKFEAPAVSNVGTSEDPVASMLARLNWTIATVVKQQQGTSVYYLEGNGSYREIGGPFKDESRELARQSIDRVSTALLPAVGPKLKAW
ncbi:MAG: hypothetical protein FD126_1573 [Elusimicrobia bacterium]|nr:MAG: hypothetical protein FD126_1573 [Elusimicrobiota bacterium]